MFCNVRRKLMQLMSSYFFFQAEDGIRDYKVTGVQTCALPISITRNLKDAGAIIIAKTGMTELANWVAGAPTPMPGNYNAVGGQGYNPYDPRKEIGRASCRERV